MSQDQHRNPRHGAAILSKPQCADMCVTGHIANTGNRSDTCVSQPYCIVQPASAADVAEVLEIITTYQVKFAVRSGGHSPNPGWSSVSGNGILIDMSSLDSVSLSADSSFATVGPGAYWGDVSTALDPSGVTVIGARAPYVGVGGMLLGGES